MDNRISLTKGYKLSLENRDFVGSVWVDELISRGGTCLVYRGHKIIQINGEDIRSSVIIKEFYPTGLNISRNLTDMSLEISNADQFEEMKEHFGKGQITHNQFFEEYNEQVLPKLFLYGEANNTVYAVSDPAKGRTLSEIDFNLLSLNRISSIMESICLAIRKIHAKKRLYLDCKPDNFFYSGKNSDLQYKVFLFDFDTVVRIDDLKRGKIDFCSASIGWVPPEQELVIDPFTGCGRYRDPNNIGYHSDIYSIGTIFFWLLMEREPKKEDLEKIQDRSFDWERESRYCSGAEMDVISKIQDILECALNPNVEQRKESYSLYTDIFEEYEKYVSLFGLTAGESDHYAPIHTDLAGINEKLDKLLSEKDTAEIIDTLPVSNNRFKYSSNSTVLRGRDNEIAILMNMCNSSEHFSWIGLCGEGGSGKSKLAYELCARMLNLKWRVFAPMRFNEYTKNDILAGLAKENTNVLICLDYIKQEMDSISVFIKYIVDKYHNNGSKIRIVLIEREEKDVKMDDYDILKYRYSDSDLGCSDGIIKLSPLSETDIREIVADYIRKQDPSKEITEESLALILKTLQSVDRELRRPLYVLFIADAWLNDNKLIKWDRNDALNYLLNREMKRLESIVNDPKNCLNIVDQKNYLSAVKFLFAMATYSGSINIADYAGQLNDRFKLASDDAMLLRMMTEFEILDNDDTVKGWVPDLIGEYFCIDFFNEFFNNWGSEATKDIVDLLIDRDILAFIRFTDMMYKDFPDVICDYSWFDLLRNIDFPAKYTYVRKNTFKGTTFLKNISFHGRITNIQSEAFRDCENLEMIIFPSSLEYIEKYAFIGCKNLIKALPEDGKGKNPSIFRIESFAFKDCVSLKSFILPISMQELGISVFENCSSLKEIEIPRKIVKLDSSVFAGCKALKTVDFSNTKEVELADSCFSDCEQLYHLLGTEKISAIGQDAFRNCKRLHKIALTPRVNAIADHAFSGCSSLQFADLSKCRISRIPERMFYDCISLIEVYLPDSIEIIGNRSFCGCKKLECFEFKPGIKMIDRYAFSGCEKLTEVKFPETLQSIESFAFENCTGIKELSFACPPEKVKDHAFAGCTSLSFSGISGLENTSQIEFCGFKFNKFSVDEFNFIQSYLSEETVTIPDSVIAIGSDAFRGTKDEGGFSKNNILKSIILPAGLRKIGDRAFSNCEKLRTVTLQGQRITDIGTSAFSGCIELEEIKGSFSATEIADGTFLNCNALRKVNFSNRLINIGKRAFKNCTKLERINIIRNWIPKSIGTAAFEGCDLLVFPIDPNLIYRFHISPRSFVLEGFVFKRITSKEIEFVRNYMKSEVMEVPVTCISVSNVAFGEIKDLKKIVIPDSIRELSPTVFKDCISLETVEFPSELSRIPGNAFENCRSLKNIIFRGHEPNSIPLGVSIGNGAFFGCKALENISLPEDLTKLNGHTFQGCTSLKSIKIPSQVTTIGNFAFKHCLSLSYVSFPDSLQNMGKGVFSECISLITSENLENTQLKVLANNLFENCINLETVTLPKSIKIIKAHCFDGCHSLKIPRVFLPNGLEVIEDAVFQNCYSIESIRLPRNITIISNYLFKNCSSLREVTMSDDITEIGQSAFYSCTSLNDEGLRLPSKLKVTGASAFSYCRSLKSLTIPEEITALSSDVFKGCSGLESVVLPKHLQEIPADCFKDCISLKHIELHEGLRKINVGAFRNCISLEYSTLNLPESLVEIFPSAFRYCDSIETVILPHGIRRLSAAVFEGCANLKEVKFEHSIADVDHFAFLDCPLLESFPFHLIEKGIGNAAFCNCRSLKNPTFSTTIRSILSAAFRGCYSITSLELPSTIYAVNGAAFRDNRNLRRVILPETVSVIKKSAFRDCVSLTEVQIKSPKINILTTAFKGCIRLDYIDIPHDNKVSVDAFESCPVETEIIENPEINLLHYKVENDETGVFLYFEDEVNGGITLRRFIGKAVGVITVPEEIKDKKVKRIADSCFEEAYGIEKIVLPESIESIGRNAFAYCKSLKNINIPSGVQSIGGYAFKECHNLVSLELPDGLKTIERGSFMYCRKLESIKLPGNLEMVSELAFLACAELSTELPVSVQSIESGAFAQCNKEKIHITHIPIDEVWFE